MLKATSSTLLGGPNEGYEWPESEHGMLHQAQGPRMDRRKRTEPIIKYSSSSAMELSWNKSGKAGQTAGSNDPNLLGRPTDITVDPEANEVYITDGYLNRRVIVFDAETGESTGIRELTVKSPTIRRLRPTNRTPLRRRTFSKPGNTLNFK